jgi:hypothetical protein
MALTKKSANRYELHSSALYRLPTVRALAEVLVWEGSPSSLRALSKRKDNFFGFEQVNEATGKTRSVQAPRKCARRADVSSCYYCSRKAKRLEKSVDFVKKSNRCIKAIQGRINTLLKQISVPSYLHSGTVGKSHLTNSGEHLRADGATVTVDISDFYQSISRKRIFRLFRNVFQCAPDVADVLADLVCFEGHLATGGHASVLLSFFSCKDMFDEIAGRFERRNATFTLYIDDIAATGNAVGLTDVKYLARTLAKFGFNSKRKKSKIFPKSKPKLVTGRAFRWGVSRAPNRSHHGMRDAIASVTMNDEDVKKKRSAIGKIEHVGMLDEQRSEHLKAIAKRLRKTIPPCRKPSQD